MTRPALRQPSGRFAAAVLVIRWTTAGVALVLGAMGHVEVQVGSLAAWSLLIVTNAVVRTIRPIAAGGRRRLVEITAELVLTSVAAVATGAFESPFAFTVMAPIVALAFGAGALPAVAASLAVAVAIGLPSVLAADRTDDDVRLVAQWTTELVLVAFVAGFAARVLTDSDEEQQRARDSLERLSDANELLATLHEITQELPATLDLDDAIDTVFTHLRSLVPVNYGGIALRDDVGSEWSFVAHLGPVDPVPDAEARLRTVRQLLATCVVTTTEGSGHLYPGMHDGRYVALRSRGELIGVLAVEHNTASLYDVHHEEALVLVSEAAALAIDNALLFRRLRHLGATEERARIARDLHDRMGQSLAYMGFELDRIHKGCDGTMVQGDIDRLRQYLRDVTGEVRETLYDLRSDVDDKRTAHDVLTEFADRVSERSGIVVSVDIDERIELSLVRQRELCRITKEAIVNAVRHSAGSSVTVTWACTHDGVLAEIRDDGEGMTGGGRDDSYGLVGMRERASGIGATLDIESSPGAGSVVRVRVPSDITNETRHVAI